MSSRPAAKMHAEAAPVAADPSWYEENRTALSLVAVGGVALVWGISRVVFGGSSPVAHDHNVHPTFIPGTPLPKVPTVIEGGLAHGTPTPRPNVEPGPVDSTPPAK